MRRSAAWWSARRASSPTSWTVLPLAVVVVTLIGSVTLPARETHRITRLLRESTEVLAPARLLQAQLQFGLARELGSLQRYALTGDGRRLDEYRLAVAEDERRLDVLEGLAPRLDVAAVDRVAALRRRIGDWRAAGPSAVDPAQPGSRAEIAVALEAAQGRHHEALDALGALSAALAAIAAARDARVHVLERRSLAYNATLVLAALVAMGAVAMLTVRERRLTASLRLRAEEADHRARQEMALRTAAEVLAGAYTVDEVTQRIASSALEVMDGSGAFVERIAARAGDPPDVAVVQVVAGHGVPAVGTIRPVAGSCTELVSALGRPALVPDVAAGGHLAEAVCQRGGIVGSAIAVPLGGGPSPGTLVVVSAEVGHFRADDVERAGVFGHLARMALENVRLLEEAREGRRSLERMIESRSRLIRGFSHDVKNPIGAADGFAELLSLGAYGELAAEQRASVARLRGCLRGALSLIGDLHELGRAETGNVSVTLEPVDLGTLLRGLGEEYQAAAHTAGLSLTIEVDADVPVLRTDGGRVRQIVSNLLSNAIKYTERGAIRVRAYHQPASSSREAGGWACIVVADTGQGIPPDKQQVIFEEFSRLDTDGREGAGLGLAISQLLARALDGRLSVESEVGRGSAFTLRLPIAVRA